MDTGIVVMDTGIVVFAMGFDAVHVVFVHTGRLSGSALRFCFFDLFDNAAALNVCFRFLDGYFL